MAGLNSCSMRLLGALALIAALAAVGSVQGHAARKPTPRERADVAQAVSMQLEHDAPAVTLRVRRVVMSTMQPDAHSTYSRFAFAYALGRDGSGRLVGSPIRALVGFSRRFQMWFVITYGSSEVGCKEPQAFFGGRRTAILRDLGLGCP